MAGARPPKCAKTAQQIVSNAHKKRKIETNKSESISIQPNQNWSKKKAKLIGKTRKFDLSAANTFQTIPEQKKQKLIEKYISTSKIVAMDCEMVGVGSDGRGNALARCSIVDYEGQVLYDAFIRPMEKVTDYRTHVSGVRSKTLKNAISFHKSLEDVYAILKDKIVVGHALRNDFKVLMLSHPKHLIRDTARYRPYMRYRKTGTKLLPSSLKTLASVVLKQEIQKGQHDSVEDARAALELYKREQIAWEKYLLKHPCSFLTGLPPTKTESQRFADPLSDDTNDTKQELVAQLPVPDIQTLANMEYIEE